jgi:hypothetical protein
MSLDLRELSPELALVDRDLAAAARRRLPEHESFGTPSAARAAAVSSPRKPHAGGKARSRRTQKRRRRGRRRQPAANDSLEGRTKRQLLRPCPLAQRETSTRRVAHVVAGSRAQQSERPRRPPQSLAGRYRWFVYPGFGAKASKRCGVLAGSRLDRDLEKGQLNEGTNGHANSAALLGLLPARRTPVGPRRAATPKRSPARCSTRIPERRTVKAIAYRPRPGSSYPGNVTRSGRPRSR